MGIKRTRQRQRLRRQLARVEALHIEGWRNSDIAARLGIDRTTVTRRIRELVDQGRIVDPAKQAALEAIDDFKALAVDVLLARFGP